MKKTEMRTSCATCMTKSMVRLSLPFISACHSSLHYVREREKEVGVAEMNKEKGYIDE